MVALANRVVIEIVCRGDLHAARAKVAVDIIVGDHRDRASAQGQFDALANQLGVTLVVRVNRDGNVAQHGFRAGGCDNQ